MHRVFVLDEPVKNMRVLFCRKRERRRAIFQLILNRHNKRRTCIAKDAINNSNVNCTHYVVRLMFRSRVYIDIVYKLTGILQRSVFPPRVYELKTLRKKEEKKEIYI